MKSIILGLLLFISPFSVFAGGGLTEADLVGEYSLVGNGGFLSYDLTLNVDGSASLSQITMGGAEIVCQGRYSLDNITQEFISVYNCEAGEVLTQEASLAGVTCDALLSGVSLSVHIKSSLGSDSTVLMSLKKK